MTFDSRVAGSGTEANFKLFSCVVHDDGHHLGMRREVGS
jgi:hypothetical protein